MTLGHSGTNYSLAFHQQHISVSSNTALNHLDEDHAAWVKDAAKVKRRNLRNQKAKSRNHIETCRNASVTSTLPYVVVDE